jgi:hypothetical protein
MTWVKIRVYKNRAWRCFHRLLDLVYGKEIEKFRNFPRFVRSDQWHVLSHFLSISRFTALDSTLFYNYLFVFAFRSIWLFVVPAFWLFNFLNAYVYTWNIGWWIIRSPYIISENFDKYFGGSSLSKEDKMLAILLFLW